MDRRTFVAGAGIFLTLNNYDLHGLLQGSTTNSCPRSNCAQAAPEAITDHVHLFRDSVNVGIVRSGSKALLIDSGDASILAYFAQSGISIDRVLYTHYHRDQCSGACRLAPAQILVPASEADFFTNASQFWLRANAILDHRYGFRPETMVLRESVDIHGLLHDGDQMVWEGIPVRAMATPGHTDGSLTYFIEIESELIAFTGDLIFGPGQISELYSLQKRFPGMGNDYWGFGGAVLELLRSLRAVRAQKPSIVIPSHGQVIRNPEQALALLEDRLLEFMQNYSSLSAWRVSQRISVDIFKEDIPPPLDVPLFTPLPAVEAPHWIHRIGATTSSYCLAEDKSIFLFDAGMNSAIGELQALVTSGAISRVDSIWISHYHDDHTSCVNTIRTRFGGQVCAQKELVDVLEQPTAYSVPCLFPEQIHVDRVLSEGEKFHWKGYDLTAWYFPGQTLYHAGILVEHEGSRVFFCGDSFGNWAIGDICSYNRNFIAESGSVAGIERCLKLLQRLEPDMLWAAHWGPIAYSPSYVEKTLDVLAARVTQLKALLPWEDPNFGLDPSWIRAYPYRQSIRPGQDVAIDMCVWNHSRAPTLVSAQLRAPKGWQVRPSKPVEIPPHCEGRVRLRAIAPRHPLARREILGLVVQFGKHNLGEVAEAIADYLSPAPASLQVRLPPG
jgi:glyoxylase-like metal-dependent hydrolase (beta-lactamase superfamily II)